MHRYVALPMFLCMFLSTVNASLDGLQFFMGLSAQPFSRLVGDMASPTICLHLSSDMAYICLIGCLCLLSVFQHLVYLLALASYPHILWTYSRGIRYFLEGPLLSICLQNFRRGFQSCQRICPIVPARSGLSVPYNIIRGTCLSCQFFWYRLLF